MSILLKNVKNHNKDIYIKDNIIKKISKDIDVKADIILNCKNKYIIPAFYNTHTHCAMNVLRGLGDDKELFSWLNEDIWPVEDRMVYEDFYWSSKMAILEMIKSGTVFFNDMYSCQEATINAINEMGVRACISAVAFDLFNEEETKRRKDLFNDFLKLKINNKRIIKTISCHAIYTVSDELFKFAVDVAKKNNMYLHIHACETKKEVEDCIKDCGLTPIEKLEKLGCLTNKTILAHCVHLTDKDISLINKYNVKVAHCPVSNLKLNSGKMAFQKMLDENCFITLGTDGASSNNNLSMIEEMKIASLSAKDQHNSPVACKAEDIFKVATKNGAKCFGLNAGVIEEGKLADFLLLDANDIQLLPDYNLISNLVYSADKNCITDVVCDGNFLMKNRKIRDEKIIIKNFKRISKKFKKK